MEELKQTALAELREEDKGAVPGRYSPERLIRTCVKLYVRTGSGFRGVSETLNVLNEEYGIGKTVSHQTISDWVKTAGLAIYKEARKRIKTSGMKYAFIIDESITIGSQKLLLILAVPAGHPGHALRHEDVIVVGIFVAKSWKAEDVSKKIKAVTSCRGSRTRDCPSKHARSCGTTSSRITYTRATRGSQGL